MNLKLSANKLTTNLYSIFLNKSLIAKLSASLLSILFWYAAYNKLSTYEQFVVQLGYSPLKEFAAIVSLLVPGVEIIIPVLFIVNRTRLIAFYSSFFLMLLFTAYVYVVPHFFNSLQTCSCGGIINGFSWRGHFYFNSLFLLIAALGLVNYSVSTKFKK